jgi:hypothetical protein
MAKILMKLNQSWSDVLAYPIPFKSLIRVKIFVWLAALSLWAIHTLGSAFYALRGDPWSHGDWLISYSQGFVRRGLLGEVLFNLSDLTSVPAGVLVLTIQIVAAGIFFVGLAACITNSELTVSSIALLLIPMSFAYVLVDPASAGRKEILLFALAVAWQRIEAKAIALGYVHLLFGFLALFLVLSHEGFVFYLPLLILISVFSNPDLGWLQILHRAMILGLPSVAAVLAISITDSRATPQGLCEPLLMAGYAEYTCSGAVHLAAESGPSGINYGLSWLSNFPPNYFLYIGLGVIYWTLVWACFLTVISTRQFAIGRTGVVILAVAAVIGTIPIFVIAVDWGRYMQMALLLFSLALIAPLTRKRMLKSPQTSNFDHLKKAILLFSVALFFVSGLAVSDAQYRSVIGTFVNVGYYLNGGLTPGIFE